VYLLNGPVVIKIYVAARMAMIDSERTTIMIVKILIEGLKYAVASGGFEAWLSISSGLST
jgi:hypothetical protein